MRNAVVVDIADMPEADVDVDFGFPAVGWSDLRTLRSHFVVVGC